MNKEQIINALKNVFDPDLHKDLISLGMIEDIDFDADNVNFKLVLTTPACPMKSKMKQDAIDAIHKHVSPNVNVNIELTSRTTSQRKDQTVLKGVKNIIAVVSGKGGVGKSTVSTNLAVSLAKLGAKVGLLDADIYGPSMPLMLDLKDAQPLAYEENGSTLIIPVEKYGVKVLSIGFFVDPNQALVWRGPMASNYLSQMLTGGEWGDLDYLVIDTPPGTGDIHLTITQNAAVTGVVIVTTPQEVALADARKAYNMFTLDNINIPVLGLVENMSWFTPLELPQNKYYIFGKDGGKKFAQEINVPLLGQIPLVQGIREGGDSGKPAAMDDETMVANAYKELAENVVKAVAIKNAEVK